MPKTDDGLLSVEEAQQVYAYERLKDLGITPESLWTRERMLSSLDRIEHQER